MVTGIGTILERALSILAGAEPDLQTFEHAQQIASLLRECNADLRLAEGSLLEAIRIDRNFRADIYVAYLALDRLADDPRFGPLDYSARNLVELADVLSRERTAQVLRLSATNSLRAKKPRKVADHQTMAALWDRLVGEGLSPGDATDRVASRYGVTPRQVQNIRKAQKRS